MKEKEEVRAVLAGLGVIVALIFAGNILKEFFDMTTSSAVACVIFGAIPLIFLILSVIEYVCYKARKTMPGKFLGQLITK